MHLHSIGRCLSSELPVERPGLGAALWLFLSFLTVAVPVKEAWLSLIVKNLLPVLHLSCFP